MISGLTAAPETHDIKLPAGTHLMHLEEGRMALWDATARFLHQDPKLLAPDVVGRR